MLNKDRTINSIVSLARQTPEIVVLWLYGSRAKGVAHERSDYDLAVAFRDFVKDDPVERRLRPECLALDWQRALSLREGELSIVDINLAPIPLAFEIIDADSVLFCRDEDRLWRETMRVHSRKELDYA